jgi:hypothetical protein
LAEKAHLEAEMGRTKHEHEKRLLDRGQGESMAQLQQALKAKNDALKDLRLRAENSREMKFKVGKLLGSLLKARLLEVTEDEENELLETARAMSKHDEK